MINIKINIIKILKFSLRNAQIQLETFFNGMLSGVHKWFESYLIDNYSRSTLPRIHSCNHINNISYVNFLKDLSLGHYFLKIIYMVGVFLPLKGF